MLAQIVSLSWSFSSVSRADWFESSWQLSLGKKRVLGFVWYEMGAAFSLRPNGSRPCSLISKTEITFQPEIQ